ncbi:peptidoglycan-binding protein [Streptomyces sp. NPDC057575]|uniref:peptidoglycan-binding domain-containing protein n=1 Tax=unclassified Streptomyces TaxID=2593676 RepID=UPI00369C0D52
MPAELQLRLHAHVDSKFGESTDVAVRAVQRCSGLNPDGQAGPQTWKYLDTPMSGCGH